MLQKLTLTNIGPASQFGPIEFGSRLNVITGDNGLGKSFILDTAWFALTRTWARKTPAQPMKGQFDRKSSISATFDAATKPHDFTCPYSTIKNNWDIKPGRPPIPGIVLYAGVDGSFSVWDPARNYWVASQVEEMPKFFDFSPTQIKEGLKDANGNNHCNGLYTDWVRWQQSVLPESQELWKALTEVLHILSPSPEEPLVPGNPTRMGISVTDIPSIRMPYGSDVPLPLASAGIQRIASLAYLLVWSWSEYKKVAERIQKPLVRDIVFLIDEIESHLHPQWQRRIIPSLLKVMTALTKDQLNIQLIVATHSPLIMASIEPNFNEETDAIFNIQLNQNCEAEVVKQPWCKQGTAADWLVSSSFGLQQARSIEAETAIEAAEAFMRGDFDALPKQLQTKDAIHKQLVKVLPSHDRFWPRWIVNTKDFDHV